MNRNNRWLLLGLLGLSGFIRQYRQGLWSMAKIQGAISYVRFIDGTRRAMITFFQILFSTVLFISGMAMIHASLFTALDGANSHNAGWIFGIGLLELIIAMTYVLWFLSTKRWIQEAAKNHPWVDEVMRKKREERNWL